MGFLVDFQPGTISLQDTSLTSVILVLVGMQCSPLGPKVHPVQCKPVQSSSAQMALI